MSFHTNPIDKVRLVSWNIAKRKQPLQALEEFDYDVALLQEFPFSKESWELEYYDRGAKVLQLSDRVEFCELQNVPSGRKHERGELTVSAPGIIAAACITPKSIESFIAVSLYARWEYPHPRTKTSWSVGYPDAMAHRAISDLSTFVGSTNPATHRIVVAGDFNLIHGAMENNRLALPARDRSVFSRLEALGLKFVGPQHPNGRQAEPQPGGLPADTKNVPTYHTSKQKPGTAANQLDYVFVSRGFHERVSVKARNEPKDWGPSDHCRIEIEIA